MKYSLCLLVHTTRSFLLYWFTWSECIQVYLYFKSEHSERPCEGAIGRNLTRGKVIIATESDWPKGRNGSVNETLVEWTEGLTEGKERPKNEWSSWMSWMNEEWQTKGKDCVKEWTWGVKTDWMLFMISEETARRKEPKVNDWEWSELLLCKEERTNGVTELPLGSEGEWVTKRTDGLKIKTQSLCFHMKDGRSDTFRFVKRSETKRLFVNETSHKDT